MTPNDFVLNCKLKRGHLVDNPSGFADCRDLRHAGFWFPRYFTRCFKAQFDTTPAEYKKKKANACLQRLFFLLIITNPVDLHLDRKIFRVDRMRQTQVPAAYRLTDNRVCQMGIDLLYRFLCGDMKSFSTSFIKKRKAIRIHFYGIYIITCRIDRLQCFPEAGLS